MLLKIRAIEVGVSGKTLASKLGVTPSTISEWLLGRRPVPLGHVCGLAKMLGIPVKQLVPEKDLTVIRTVLATIATEEEKAEHAEKP